MKPGRLWHPLDVEFWDDPDTLAVGESGAVLFLRLIAYAKKHQTDGYVPMEYVKRIGGRRWQAKMEPIVRQGWATMTDETAPDCARSVAALSDICGAKWCHVVAFLAWNDSSENMEQRREIAREKKRKQRAATAIVPQGQTQDVPGHRVEVETKTEQNTPSGVCGAGAPPAQGVPESTPLPGSIGAVLRAAPLPADLDGPCQLPEFTEATIKAVRKQVHDLYTSKLAYCHDLNGQHIQRLTQTLRGVAQARGEALPAVVERTVLGFLADPYWQSKRWPLNGLVSQAARYADPARPEDIKVPNSGKNDAKIGSLRSKLSAAETERRLAASMNPGALPKLDERIDGMRREMKRLEGAA